MVALAPSQPASIRTRRWIAYLDITAAWLMLQVVPRPDLRGGTLLELEFLTADLDIAASRLVRRVGHGAHLRLGVPVQLSGFDLGEKIIDKLN